MSATSYLIGANLGIGNVSQPNPNLNGQGPIVQCLVASAADQTTLGGTRIGSITIKGAASTRQQGIVRLFLFDGTSYYLLREVAVSPTNQSGVLPTFSAVINRTINLKPGYQIFASTEMADTFNVIVSGVNYGSTDTVSPPAGDCSYPAIQYGNNTGSVFIDTANPNINGTGEIGTVLKAIAQRPFNYGTRINKITIKAAGSTTQGMVRLYINDLEGKLYLWMEIPVAAQTPGGPIKTFSQVIRPRMVMNPGTTLFASTENAEPFNIIADATDFICNPS